MSLNNKFKLNLVAAACLSVAVPAHAGQIVGVASGEVYDSQDGPVAFGIGGWDLSNVTPLIIDVDTGEEIAKTFDVGSGTYSAMEVGDSFKSVVYADETKTVATGEVHGKDWPVGEPHGIKVANHADINEVLSNSKPASCILSTSFYRNSDDAKNYDENGTYIGPGLPSDGWLDTASEADVNPTYCNSPFQTHKRFKVDALTPTADDVDDRSAKPIDLVFNVEDGGDAGAVRRYMVLQKLNNYSDSRYSGYEIEVGFGVGDSFQNASAAGAGDNLKLSIGTGEDEGEDIWAEDDLAPFSAGLFGTADNKHPYDGFFDTRRAGFLAALDANETKIYSTGPQESNYIPIFGNWLPSKWEPTGIFFDDDGDPLTDAKLVAYWGASPTNSDLEWRKGVADNFRALTDDELEVIGKELVKEDSLYSMDGIEDLLNLGLTYIVEVGDVAGFTDSTFTLRLQPIASTEASDAEEPSWEAEPAPQPSTSYGGGSASALSTTSMLFALMSMLGLGGWLASRRKV